METPAQQFIKNSKPSDWVPHQVHNNPRSPDYEAGRIAGAEEEIIALRTRVLELHIEKENLLTWLISEEQAVHDCTRRSSA